MYAIFFLRFFWRGQFLKSLLNVTILLLFYVLVFLPWGMWDLSSLTRDWTCTPSLEGEVLNHWTAGKSLHMYIIYVPSDDGSVPLPGGTKTYRTWSPPWRTSRGESPTRRQVPAQGDEEGTFCLTQLDSGKCCWQASPKNGLHNLPLLEGPQHFECLKSTRLTFEACRGSQLQVLTASKKETMAQVSKVYVGTSLVAQWLRIHLPMQGTRVQALVREDPTCRGKTKPVCHNYWACALAPACCNYWSPRASSPCPTTREATAMRSPRTATKSSPRSPQLEKACTQQRRPNADKHNIHTYVHT